MKRFTLSLLMLFGLFTAVSVFGNAPPDFDQESITIEQSISGTEVLSIESVVTYTPEVVFIGDSFTIHNDAYKTTTINPDSFCFDVDLQFYDISLDLRHYAVIGTATYIGDYSINQSCIFVPEVTSIGELSVT